MQAHVLNLPFLPLFSSTNIPPQEKNYLNNPKLLGSGFGIHLKNLNKQDVRTL
jgi:hypothetical protein